MLRIILLLTFVLFQSSCFEQVVQSADPNTKNQVEPDLPPDHPPVPDTETTSKPSILANGTMVLGSRFFVASVLKNIFTTTTLTASQTIQFNKIIDEGLFRYPHIFGGAANLYSTRGMMEMTDARCFLSCSNENYQELPLNMASTPARGVLLSKMCARILDDSAYLAAGLEKVGINIGSPFTAAPDFNNNKIAGIYELFFLNKPDAQIQEALATSVASAKTKGFSNIEQWRFAFLLVCESGQWQML